MRLNICLREATIQIGVFFLQINKALLQRRMYFKKVVRMSFHAWLCRQQVSDLEAKFMFEIRSCGQK